MAVILGAGLTAIVTLKVDVQVPLVAVTEYVTLVAVVLALVSVAEVNDDWAVPEVVPEAVIPAGYGDGADHV